MYFYESWHADCSKLIVIERMSLSQRYVADENS